MSKYKVVITKYVIAIATIVSDGLYLLISAPLSERSENKTLNNFRNHTENSRRTTKKEEMTGMTIYRFIVNLGAAGPIKVGFGKIIDQTI